MSESALKALDILSFLARSETAATLREVAEGLGLNRATTLRLLQSLSSGGWVVGEGRPKRYMAGMRLLAAGLSIDRFSRRRETLLPYAVEIAEQTRQPAVLAFYEDGKVLVSDVAEVRGGQVAVRSGGQEFPAVCTAAGKVLLGYRPEEEILAVVQRGVPRFTPRTLTDAADILRAVRRAREQGYGTADREYLAHSSGVAVPVLDAGGHAVASLGIPTLGPLTEDSLRGALQPAIPIGLRASIEMGFSPGRETTSIPVG